MWQVQLLAIYCAFCTTKGVPTGREDEMSLVLSSTALPTSAMDIDIHQEDSTLQPEDMIVQMSEETSQTMLAPIKINASISSFCPPKPADLIAAEMECERRFKKMIISVNHTGEQYESNTSSNGTTKITNMKTSKGSKAMTMMFMPSCSFHCILQQLRLLDEYGYPHEGHVTEWLTNHTSANTKFTTRCFATHEEQNFGPIITSAIPRNKAEISKIKQQEDEKQKIEMPVAKMDACESTEAIIACLDEEHKCLPFKRDIAA